MSGRARATVQVDNDRVRVTEWRFARDEATGWHRHEYDYVVVPMTVGPLRIRTAQAARCRTTSCPARRTSGSAGAEHDVWNPNDREVVFVEIEIKSPMKLTGIPRASRFPRMTRVKQTFHGPTVENVPVAVRAALGRLALPVKAGQSVALTVGSRGVVNIERDRPRDRGALEGAGRAARSSSPRWGAMAAGRPRASARSSSTTG